MTITVPEFALVFLIGPSGCGKSTFAHRHFRPTEILSSDSFRGMVRDDERDQAASADAFEVLHLVCGKRLAAGRLTVVDATNVRPESRKPLLDLARRYHAQPVAVVFDFPAEFCHDRNLRRHAERPFGPEVTRRHADDLARSLPRLREEGFRRVTVLRSEVQVNAAAVVRQPLPVDKRHDRGPFDIIGDVHGCLPELLALLGKLGYAVRPTPAGWDVGHLAGRRPVFVGDLGDRGPDTPGVFRVVMDLCARGAARCVMGNHDDKLLRWLRGDRVRMTHGLDRTAEQFGAGDPALPARVREFLSGLPAHLVLDGGRLVVAHAGLPAEMHGRVSGRVRAFALYGDTTGKTDDLGLPVRRDWAADYRGRAAVVYGHNPTADPGWVNRCLCVDTGCVFGGRLTALRWPERELVSVPAERQYAEPARPLLFRAAAGVEPRPGGMGALPGAAPSPAPGVASGATSPRRGEVDAVAPPGRPGDRPTTPPLPAGERSVPTPLGPGEGAPATDRPDPA